MGNRIGGSNPSPGSSRLSGISLLRTILDVKEILVSKLKPFNVVVQQGQVILFRVVFDLN